MKIFVVEDNEMKKEDIFAVINQMDIECELKTAATVSSCLSAMAQEYMDILILDLQLPMSARKDNILKDGGSEIISSLKDDPRMIKPGKIVYLSAYSEVLENEKSDFSQTGILYKPDSEEWKRKLKESIQFYVDSAKKRKRIYNYDVAILTATPIEYKKMKELSKNWRVVKYPNDSIHYEETCWKRKRRSYRVIGCKLNQMGMPAAATVATKLIYQFTPKYLLMFGIAGGVEKDANLGDVVVATKVWDYCSGKYDASLENEKNASLIDNFKPTSNSINADSQITNMQDRDYSKILEQIFRSYVPSKTQNPPKLWWGSLACGSSVVKNRAIIDKMVLKFDRKTIAVDMESYGLFYAAENAINPKPKAVCVKAISDFADREKIDDYQDYAAMVSANFSKELILGLLDDSQELYV